MGKIFDVIIIGTGIAGLAAAIYCARLNLKTIVIGKQPGGTLVNASLVENYPGFSKISGIGLMKKVLEHAKEYNPEILGAVVEKISPKKNLFEISTKKKHFLTKTIIFCTGSEWGKLGVHGEKEFTNKGVHYCALCDGFFYRNKIVAVLGGGDSAVKEALLLSKHAKKVYIISRGKLKPEPINLKRIKAEKKIQIIEGAQVKQITGKNSADSIILDKKLKNSNILKLDGVFVEIGRVPLSGLAVKLGVRVNKNKEIITDKESKTSIKGIYAAGDVTDTKLKQAITGVGEAVRAVYSAYEYLNHKQIFCY